MDFPNLFFGLRNKSVQGALLATGLILSPTLVAAEHAGWDKSHRGEALDLGGYTISFEDNFDRADITTSGGKGPWFAPIHGSYGVAKFDPPNGKTYRTQDGHLIIQAVLEPSGWHAGTIQTVDSHGNGFAQQFGYFEARLKVPPIPGAWPAFWLKSQRDYTDKTATRTEIDIVEWYGGDPRGVHSAVHLWPAAQPKSGELAKHWFHGGYARLSDLSGEWHDFGALITKDLVIVYLDRKEVYRHVTPPEAETPLYPLVSLSLYEKDVKRATSPIDLAVDYVRIYKPKGT